MSLLFLIALVPGLLLSMVGAVALWRCPFSPIRRGSVLSGALLVSLAVGLYGQFGPVGARGQGPAFALNAVAVGFLLLARSQRELAEGTLSGKGSQGVSDEGEPSGAIGGLLR